MKFTRTLATIVLAALLITACNRESGESNVAILENSNPLLAYVPTDTPYVYADLEVIPGDITDSYVTRFQPVLDVMSDRVAGFQEKFANGEFEGNEMARFASVVLDELGGSLSLEYIEKFGINLQAHHVLYGTGVFPVMRVELHDAQAFRNSIGRIEAKMGFELPEKDFNGTSYWHLSEEDMPFSVYFAILDQQLAVTAFPEMAESSLLAAFLGQDLPVNSIATSNKLAILNNEKGYSNYGTGILDFQKLAYELLNESSATRSYLSDEISDHFSALDEVCIAEINSMIDKAPRMTAGITNLTSNELSIRYDMEIESLLATGLARLVSDVPVALEDSSLLSASLAIQIGKLRTFVLEKATNITTNPYQCERLEELNRNAVDLVQQLNIPMPPMVNNLNGVRVRLNDFEPDMDLTNMSGLMALYVDKPEMFVGMATMMVPGFDEIDLPNQTEPVRIPTEVIRMDNPEVFALMNKDAIGAVIGEQNIADLKGFLAEKQGNDGVFLSASYDMARQIEIQEAIYSNMEIESDQDYSAAHELSDAAQEAYKAMLGRSRVELSLDENGLRIDSTMTFK